MKILDLGCGTGYLSALLADCVGPAENVVAIVPNRSRLELATKQHLKTNLVFLETNDVTLREDQYDLVFANYVLQWIEDKFAVLSKIIKILNQVADLHLLYLSLTLQFLSRWTI